MFVLDNQSLQLCTLCVSNPAYLKPLRSVAVKEGGSASDYDANILSFAIDEYSQAQKGGATSPAVDAVCGHSGNTLLLVEFKLNATTGRSIRVQDLYNKFSASSALLLDNAESLKICEELLLILPKKSPLIRQKVIRQLNEHKFGRKVHAITAQQFNSLVKLC